MKLLSILILVPVVAWGESRTSTSYTLIQETSHSDHGARSSSANYTLDIGGEGGGVSASSDYTHRDGFAGQLLDPKALLLVATPDPVAEETPTQIMASVVYDDDTVEAGVTPTYTLGSDSLLSVSPAGLVQTGPVFEDTVASVDADYLGILGTVSFTLQNTTSDNFKSYGGDNLPDDWQLEHFGPPPNGDAAPDENPDGDRGDNRFEYLTGYDPNDGNSSFSFDIVSKSAGTAIFQASKMITGTRYILMRSNDLGVSDPWAEIDSFTVGDEILEAPLEDASAPVGSAFYYIEVEEE